MSTIVHIALIGDFDVQKEPHLAIPQALALSAHEVSCTIAFSWLSTLTVAQLPDEFLSVFDGIWCAPGSPYESMEGAIKAIRYAREQKVPFLGTCGGFQHAVIEYARNVLDLLQADHAESNPSGALLLIAPLSCSLVGTSGKILLTEGSSLADMYGNREAIELYQCNFGVNPQYSSLLEGTAIRVNARDEDGEIRAIELENHPFFIGTLFQPERSAFAGIAHPLITAFVRAGVQHKHTEPIELSAQ